MKGDYHMTSQRYDRPVPTGPLSADASPLSPASKSVVRTARRRTWPMLALAVFAIIATLAVAIVLWFRPTPQDKRPPAPMYSDQQVSEAKAKVCAAFVK